MIQPKYHTVYIATGNPLNSCLANNLAKQIHLLNQFMKLDPDWFLNMIARLTSHRGHFIQHIVQGPEVRGPIGMAQASLEGEKSRQDLR